MIDILRIPDDVKILTCDNKIKDAKVRFVLNEKEYLKSEKFIKDKIFPCHPSNYKNKKYL